MQFVGCNNKSERRNRTRFKEKGRKIMARMRNHTEKKEKGFTPRFLGGKRDGGH